MNRDKHRWFSSTRGRDRAGVVAAATLWLGIASATLAQESSTPFLDWSALRNPILAAPDRMIKDPAVVYDGGWFYIFASQRFEPETEAAYREKWVVYRSRDLKTFETLHAPELFPPPMSPDLTRHDGLWYLTYHLSLSDGNERQLHYSTSPDLLTWTAPSPLAAALHPDTSSIDTATGWVDGYAYLGYKRGQHFHVTRSRGRGIDGEWLRPQPASAGGEWAENYQFLPIDGTWRMLATSRDPGAKVGGAYTGNHAPFLFRIDGNGASIEDWTRWIEKTPLEIPGEDWNTVMRANSAYLCDWREYDGHFYLFYAGANDGERFKGRGHAKLGVARSTDLRTWIVPGNHSGPN